MKYHISKNGVPVICRATKRACPLGGDESHFDTYKEAQKYIDNHHEEKYGLLASIDEVEWDPRVNAGELEVSRLYERLEPTDDVDQNKDAEWELREFIYEFVEVPNRAHHMAMHMRYYKDGVEVPDSSKVVNVAGFRGSALSEGLGGIISGSYNGHTSSSRIDVVMMEDQRLEVRATPDLEDDPSAEGVEVRYNFYYTPEYANELVRYYPEMVFTPNNLIKFRDRDFWGYEDQKRLEGEEVEY